MTPNPCHPVHVQTTRLCKAAMYTPTHPFTSKGPQMLATRQARRSLLSSTDSCQNPAESGQFPEFQRNQFWQRGLPNRSNDSGGILNRIRQNGIMTPKSSVGICRCSIWVSSTNNAHSFSTTLIVHDAHLTTLTNARDHAPPSPTTTTARMTWQRHVSQRTSGHIDRDGGYHVTVGDVAT